MFEILKMEFKKSLIKQKGYFLLMLLSFSSLIVVFVITMNYMIDTNKKNDEYKEIYKSSTYYNLYPNTEYMQDITVEKVDSLRNAYNELVQKFKYDASYQHPIFMDKKNYNNGEKFLEGYENGKVLDDGDYLPIKGYFIGKYFNEIENPKVDIGRSFNKEDFSYNEKNPVKIVLGADYKEIYKVGDIIDIIFLGENKGEIIGFYENDAFILDESKKVSLNRYMTVPSVDVEEGSFKEENRGIINGFYTFKMLGRLVLNNNELDKKFEFEKILGKYNLYDFFLYNKTSSADKVYYAQVENTKIMGGLAIIILIFSFITLITSMVAKVYKNIKKYSIYILSGARPGRIMIMVLIESIITYIMASVLAFIGLFYMYKKGINPYVLNVEVWGCVILLILVIIILSYIIVVKKVKSLGISQLLRRND